MEAVFGTIALVIVVGAVVGLVLLARAVRTVRRGVYRTTARARALVEETGLRARRVAPGAFGEVAALRLRLRASMAGTREALEAGVAADPSLREALGLLERLRDHAGGLDEELRLLEREPDPARITARLPGLRDRAGRITHSADSLRWAAQDRARQFADDDLAALGRQIEVEAGALRHWVPGGPADLEKTDLENTEPEQAAPQPRPARRTWASRTFPERR